MSIWQMVQNKKWPSVVVGLGCLFWTVFVYMNFLSWLGFDVDAINKPVLVGMSLSWAIGLGLMPLTIWVAWVEVGRVRAFLVIHTLVFLAITVWVVWLLLSFERPDSWTCIDSQQFELLCLFWYGLLFLLFLTPFEFLVDDNTTPRRDLILIVNLATLLNFNALPWIANLNCGGFFLDENWRNIELFVYTVTCMPVILVLSLMCVLRWRRQSLALKWLVGGLLTVSTCWFALTIGTIVSLVVISINIDGS